MHTKRSLLLNTIKPPCNLACLPTVPVVATTLPYVCLPAADVCKNVRLVVAAVLRQGRTRIAAVLRQGRTRLFRIKASLLAVR